MNSFYYALVPVLCLGAILIALLTRRIASRETHPWPQESALEILNRMLELHAKQEKYYKRLTTLEMERAFAVQAMQSASSSSAHHKLIPVYEQIISDIDACLPALRTRLETLKNDRDQLRAQRLTVQNNVAYLQLVNNLLAKWNQLVEIEDWSVDRFELENSLSQLSNYMSTFTLWLNRGSEREVQLQMQVQELERQKPNDRRLPQLREDLSRQSSLVASLRADVEAIFYGCELVKKRVHLQLRQDQCQASMQKLLSECKQISARHKSALTLKSLWQFTRS
jgi:hypothetical protein